MLWASSQLKVIVIVCHKKTCGFKVKAVSIRMFSVSWRKEFDTLQLETSTALNILSTEENETNHNTAEFNTLKKIETGYL